MPIKYLNENLLPGNLGYLFVVLSFGTAIFGLISFLFYTKYKDVSWRNIARTSFIIHFLSVTGIFATLFYLIYTHQFQYYYVYAHSSKDLPAQYMLSCFWEGQEGSFLLWTFWHSVLGLILIWRAKTWEGPVMAVLCLAQIALSSMLLGMDKIDIFGLTANMPMKLGSNPFILFRNHNPEMPLFGMKDYATKIADGRGLNPLLQNYWMVIHPPVLFLGFASTIIPFCYAMAGLWQKRYGEWVRPALPWTLFNCMVLGTGILMGGAWAYEALSFGGFWAWDPVENASLVPWMLMIAGLHTMVIYNSRKSSLGASYIMVTIGFLLILYSTFLTRSGILGDSSVHSFTDLGLSGQLLIFMFIFIAMAAFYLIKHWKRIPKTEKEEHIYSREFWMFIGSLIVSLSALHIISITSIPVINKIAGGINSLLHTDFKTNLSAPTDAIGTYHRLQIPFAIIIALMIGFGQYFKYLKTEAKVFWKKTGIAAAVALVLTVPFAFYIDLEDPELLLLLFTSFFAITGNADILWGFVRKSRFAASGAAVAHIGMGFILLGALVANGKKEVISLNTEGIDLFGKNNQKETRENKMLVKGFPIPMGGYLVNYAGDSTDKNHIFYKIQYQKLGKDGKKEEEFELIPYVVFDKVKNQITAPSPDTRHYFSKDVFTHVTSSTNKTTAEYQVEYDTTFQFDLHQGDVVKVDTFTVTMDSVISSHSGEGAEQMYKVQLHLKVTDGKFTYYPDPFFLIAGNNIEPQPVEVHDFGLKFFYTGLNPKGNPTHHLAVMKGKRPEPDFVTLKAIIFPFINFLWMGSLIMIIGFAISIIRRSKDKLSLKKLPLESIPAEEKKMAERV